MLVTDIGGTLLFDNNTITKDNIKVFKYAKEKGINITLAIARMYSSTKYISNIIKADYGVYGNWGFRKRYRNAFYSGISRL